MNNINEMSIQGRGFRVINVKVIDVPPAHIIGQLGVHQKTIIADVFCDGYEILDLQFLRYQSGRKVPIKLLESDGGVIFGQGVITKGFKSERLKGSNNRVAKLEIKIISKLER